MPRKRFSAFDDFPAETPKKGGDEDWQPEEDDAPGAETRSRESAKGQPSPLFSTVLSAPEPPSVERIERLTPSQMMPDRFQPRRLLPTALRQPFFSGQIDCYTAARQWLQIARVDSGVKKEVERLLAMGTSFEEHGQIKPITGAWKERSDGSFFFQIETGERRFWAACLQRVANKEPEEPSLRVEVIANPTRMRQVLENRHAEPPSAVGQACEVASLILAELGVPPDPGLQDEYEYFRQWRARRMPTGMWEKITPVMQLTRERMVQLLNILELPNLLLDTADSYRVPERVLREVLRAPQNQRERLLMESIQNEWTAEDVAVNTRAETVEKKTPAAPDRIQQAMNGFRRFIHALEPLDDATREAIFDELANDMVTGDRGEAVMDALRSLTERVRIRQQNRYNRRR